MAEITQIQVNGTSYDVSDKRLPDISRRVKSLEGEVGDIKSDVQTLQSPITIKAGINNIGSGSGIGYNNLTGDNNYGVSIGSFNSNNKQSVVIGVGAVSELSDDGACVILANGAWDANYISPKIISNDGYGNNFILEEGGKSILGNSTLLANLAKGASSGTILISKSGAYPTLLTSFTSENLSQPVSNFSIRVTFSKNLKNELNLTSGELTGTNLFYAWSNINISKASHTGALLLGSGLISGKAGQIVIGTYNKKDKTSSVVIGCGMGEYSRANAITIDSSGVSFPLGLRSTSDVTSNNGANSLNTLATKVAALEKKSKNILFIKPSEYLSTDYPSLANCIGNPSAFGRHMNVSTVEDDMLHSDGYRFNNMDGKPIYLKFMGMTTDDNDMYTKTFSLMDGEGNIYLLKAESDAIISFNKKA